MAYQTEELEHMQHREEREERDGVEEEAPSQQVVRNIHNMVYFCEYQERPIKPNPMAILFQRKIAAFRTHSYRPVA